MDDEWFRNTSAQTLAHMHMISVLARLVLKDVRPEDREAVGRRIVEECSPTDFLTGMTKGDEFASERLADIAIRARKHCEDTILGLALGIPLNRGP